MKTMLAFGLWLYVCAFTVWAQGAQPPGPAFEAGVAYTYNDVTTSDSAQSIQSGASAYALYFFRRSPRRWDGYSKLGIAAEFGGSGSGSGSLFTYTFGPRWGIEWRHVFFYTGSEIGGARIRVNGIGPDGAPVSFIRNTVADSFALTGVELLFGRWVVRLLQADDLEFQAPDPYTGKMHWQGGIRASAGIAFRFGKKP